MTDGAASFLTMAFAAHDAGEKVTRGHQRLAGSYPCYRVYACKGGGYYSVGALEPKFWRTLCDALERPDLFDLQYSEDMAAQTDVEKIFMTHTREEWQEKLSDLDACCEPVLDIDEVAGHAQVASRAVLRRGEVRPAIVMRDDWRRRDAPRLGEHSAEILKEVGVEGAHLEDLRKAGVIG